MTFDRNLIASNPVASQIVGLPASQCWNSRPPRVAEVEDRRIGGEAGLVGFLSDGAHLHGAPARAWD